MRGHDRPESVRRAGARVASLALVLLAPGLLAGCFGAGGPAEGREGLLVGRTFADVPCPGLDTGRGSGNAPPFALFDLDVEEVASRLALALGDRLQPDAPAPDPVVRDASRAWKTERGQIELLTTPAGAFAALRYWGLGYAWTPPDGSRVRDDYEHVLDALELPVDALGPLEIRVRNDTRAASVVGSFVQTYRDARVDWAVESQYGHLHVEHARVDLWARHEHATDTVRSQFMLGRLADLRDAEPTHPRDEAEAAALAWTRCALESAGWLHETGDSLRGMGSRGFAIAHGSLAFVVPVAYELGPECHEQRGVQVLVDAVTGSVLGALAEGETCIE